MGFEKVNADRKAKAAAKHAEAEQQEQGLHAAVLAATSDPEPAQAGIMCSDVSTDEILTINAVPVEEHMLAAVPYALTDQFRREQEALERSSERPPKSEWTLNGKAIPTALQHLITWEYTDQCQAERRAADIAAGNHKYPKVQMGAGDWEHTLDRVADSEVTMPWEEKDPIRAAIAKIPPEQRAGKRFHLASPRYMDRNGGSHPDGWQPEVDKNGNLRKLASMVICSMPEDMARKRDAFFESERKDAVRSAITKYGDEQRRFLSDAGAAAQAQYAPIGPEELLRDSIDPVV